MARPLGSDIVEDLQLLGAKIKQAKMEYDQYFLGNRPREPVLAKGEVQKIIAYWSNLPIRNTANRFRFNNLCARFFTFRRQWGEIVRKIEEGTYEPHNLRARRRVPLDEADQPQGVPEIPAASVPADDAVCDAYLEARRACGQGGVARERVVALIRQQREAIREKFGCRDVLFRVVVEDGRPKLKATPLRA